MSDIVEEESRFRSLLALSSDWYWEQDASLRFTSLVCASDEIRSSLPSIVGRRRWEVPYANMTEADWAAHRKIIDARQPFRDLELCWVDARGAEKWIWSSGEPVYTSAGAFAGYRGIGRDITRHKRAVEALRRSEQRFQAFMNHSPAIAWIKDSRLVYTYVSEPFLARLKKTREQMIGHTDLECWPEAPEPAYRSWQSDLHVQRTQQPLQTLDSGVRVDGADYHWLSMRFPLPDEQGAIGVAGTAVEITERVEAEAAARAYAEEARALLGRLISAQESERKRVATELHDLIGQNLTALGIWLTNLSGALGTGRPELAPQLDNMRRTVEQTIESIRGVMADLRPPGLEEYGLLFALRTYAGRFQASTSLQVLVECYAPLRRLPAAVEMSLFRIVQEALANAAKHGGGTRVRVKLEQTDGMLRIGVEDDGRGMPEAVGARKTHHGGWGLPAMRERAEACGGSLRIEQPGRGTRLVVEVPVRHAN